MSEITLPSDAERQMLRDSLGGFLAERWPASDAPARSCDPQAVTEAWRGMASLGLATLGSDPEEGGLREISIVMEALGRTACPAPMLGAALFNLALAPRDGEPRAALPPALDSLRTDLYAGEARICVAFGSADHEPEAGAVVVRGNTLDGTLRFVDAAAPATQLLVAVDDGRRLAVVELAGARAQVCATRSMGTDGLCEVTLSGAPAAFVDATAAQVADLNLVARLCLLARAYGASRRAFELAVDYAKERRQFGRPIGSFQAIQHKLANCLIYLEGVRLTQWNAASAFDRGSADWRYFASAALAFGAATMRQVSLETHHAFGAIGYAEEHEAPRHFRRVHCDLLAHGGLRQARVEVADALFRDGDSLPRYDLGAAGNAFRDEVRAWLRQYWSGERKAEFDRLPYERREFDPSFALDLGKTGWIGLSWPREYGGQERTPLEQLAFLEEMERADAPRAGAAVQANALIMFGTPAQRAKYLPEILRGEAMHGMGYSEPDSGSDLASLRTSATRDGDHWVINGQKIWTTTWWGRYMFLAARTDRDANPPHAGISMFIVPMDAPGITIKPARTMYDGTFANIFYDDVRLPADALVGEVNGGWRVLTGALSAERGLVGGGIVLKVVRLFELLCAYVRQAQRGGSPLHADPLVRDRLATLAAEVEVGRQLMVRCAELSVGGHTPPEWGAMSKVFSGELLERLGEAALDILGMRATLSQGASGCLANGKFEQALRHSLMWVISIGTNEIQRNLIAQRGLGLPR